MQKLKVKHLFFALGHGERTDFMQGFCVEYDPEVWRLCAKPARFSLVTCPFFPVALQKHECGAYPKYPVGQGVSFCFFLFARPRLTERKRSASENRVGPSVRMVKKEAGTEYCLSRPPAMKHIRGGMVMA